MLGTMANGRLSSNQSQDYTKLAKDIIELETKLSRLSADPDKARDISVSLHVLTNSWIFCS
jgi:hypothetical protein